MIYGLTFESIPCRMAKRMRFTAWIVALLIAVGFPIILIIDGIKEGAAAIETAGILLMVLNVIALAGAVLFWLWDWLADVLLVLVTAGFGAHVAAYAGRNHFFTWLTAALPYLVAGSLFFISWHLAKKVKTEG